MDFCGAGKFDISHSYDYMGEIYIQHNLTAYAPNGARPRKPLHHVFSIGYEELEWLAALTPQNLESECNTHSACKLNYMQSTLLWNSHVLCILKWR